ncbi:hypothetical protein [Saccharicrinis fermentans]|uniref:Uncharacterized protein n=1 Tax=Saccharicrinis fermentans DSM 9555 = JCM 21142 TaxID=869213 RepID=W7YA16_9BACT|nr:hypothetical protein [Saccharicrinis fermentans]GAF04398.1 hypothetical protein JCM21142_83102 [Saccharicrinis fermentans DSM 9555 = JCM 21142]
MKSFTSLLTLILILFLSTKVYADKAYMKYGKITQKEIDMTSCPIDSNASAVMLGAIGQTYFNIEQDKILMLTQRHIRIKVCGSKSILL